MLGFTREVPAWAELLKTRADIDLSRQTLIHHLAQKGLVKKKS